MMASFFVRIQRVVLPESRVGGHETRVGVELCPKAPGCLDDRQACERLASIGAALRTQQHLIPEALGGPVEHHQVVLQQDAGNPEIAGLPAADTGVESDARTSQRAVRNEDWLPAQGVVDYFVPPKHADRIGARLAPHHQSQYAIIVCHDRLFGRADIWICQSRNGVAGEGAEEQVGRDVADQVGIRIWVCRAGPPI